MARRAVPGQGQLLEALDCELLGLVQDLATLGYEVLGCLPLRATPGLEGPVFEPLCESLGRSVFVRAPCLLGPRGWLPEEPRTLLQEAITDSLDKLAYTAVMEVIRDSFGYERTFNGNQKNIFT